MRRLLVPIMSAARQQFPLSVIRWFISAFCFPNFSFPECQRFSISVIALIPAVFHPLASGPAPPSRQARLAARFAAVDKGPEKGHSWAMGYLLTSDLKQRTAKVLAAALKKPQFVFRDGEVFVIRHVVLADVPDAGGGDMDHVIADTWDKLGPAPEIDYDKL